MANGEDWQRVIALNEVPNGGLRCLERGAVRLLICRVHDEAYAVINRCPHLGLDLDQAAMYEHELVCPHHNACFDIRSGKPTSGPSVFPLGGYPCRVLDGEVEVDFANPDSTMDRHMRAVNAAKR